MLGHRSVRMAITNPEIPEMQIKAVLDAAAELIKEGKHPKPEIEIPLVIIAPEVKAILEIAVKVAAQVKKEQGFSVPYARHDGRNSGSRHLRQRNRSRPPRQSRRL